MYLDSNLHNSSLFFIHKVRFNEQILTKRSFRGWKWTLEIKVWRSLMLSLHQPGTFFKICFTRKHFKSQISFVWYSALQSTLWILSFHWASALDKFGKPASQRITVQIERSLLHVFRTSYLKNCFVKHLDPNSQNSYQDIWATKGRF